MSAADRPSEEAIDAAASQWSDWDTYPETRHHLRRYAEVALKAAYAVDFPAGSGPQQDERFARLAELKGNWDSYGGLPIDAAAMERAKAWLRNAAVIPCSDGGVQLEWHSDGCDVEIVFRPDGSTEAYAEKVGSGGPTPEGERRTGQRDVEQMRDDLHRLGMLALQSDRYQCYLIANPPMRREFPPASHSICFR